MNHEELLTLVAQLSAANLELRKTIADQKEHIEYLVHQLSCEQGCMCMNSDDCDGSCQ